MSRNLSSAKARAVLMTELEHAIRRSTASGAIFSQSVANYVGVSSSDLECLDFLNLEGRVTAGRLAEVTGLTTGAITGVVDRLEKAGFVRRERDEEDRRKVFIVPVPENIAKVGKCYEPVQRAMFELWRAYSESELRLLLRFADDGYKAMLAATEQLKAQIETQKSRNTMVKKSAKSRR
jgi:DNA-binding MarR family transcriptional regulator